MKRFSLIIFILLFVVTLLLPVSSFGAVKKALLIGIDNYKNLPFYSNEYRRWINNLKGPLNDVRIMKEALTSRYGFREEDIRVLTEKEATRDNIIKAFENWLINGTKQGDLVFFYFSGHGTQVPDQNGDEEDGLDEALCPYDVEPKGSKNVIEARLIIDDELGEMLRKLAKRDVTIVVDACHSGSVTRSINRVPVSDLEETPAYQARFIPVEIDESHVRGKAFSLDIPRQEDIPDDQIFISSSRADQISLEIALPEGFHGAMTSGLVEGMNQRRDSTYRELFEYARKVVKDRHGLEQDPQLEPEKGKLVQNVAFSFTYTIVTQLKPEDQKPQPEKPKPSAYAEPSVSSPSKPQPSPPQVVRPESQEPPELKPEPPLLTSSPSKPKPTPQVVKPQEPIPVQTIPPVAPPVPPKPEKPSSVPQPPPEIKGEKVLLRIEPIQGATTSQMEALRNRLRGLPYVDVVEENFFDRLIRGEFRNEEYHVRLLNRIGDVIKFPPTKNIDELIKAMAPHLEYAYIVKQLAHIQHPDPPFKVSISVSNERRDFKIGEKIAYDIFCEEDCYLLMLNLDSHGNFHIIFPNKFHKDNFVKAGSTVQVPDQETKRRKFEFQFFPPAGEETVKVIATNAQLKLDSLNLKEFKETFKKVSGSAMKESSPSRGLAKDILTVIKEESKNKEFRWSEDTVMVRSHE